VTPSEREGSPTRALASNVWVEDRVVTRLTKIEPGLALSAADLLMA
jgi:hypothetical protein